MTCDTFFRFILEVGYPALRGEGGTQVPAAIGPFLARSEELRHPVFIPDQRSFKGSSEQPVGDNQ